MPALILLRGGGDLASGVALRLHRAGLRVAICEIAQPLAVRRQVAFAEAVYAGSLTVEGVTARLAKDPSDTLSVLMLFSRGLIPVLVDPQAEAIASLHPTVVVDARMLKEWVPLDARPVPLLIGLGPGFEAGVNCHAAVETNRGHFLGRVYWQGGPEPDTGAPDPVLDKQTERVLRAPAAGVFTGLAEIGDLVEPGALLAQVDGQPLTAPFRGLLRGLLHSGLRVTPGLKVGDLDPRADRRFASLVSDKSLAVGGGVVEAILARPNLRAHLWT
jgi:xanthine dehydrogenase accessory factor